MRISLIRPVKCNFTAKQNLFIKNPLKKVTKIVVLIIINLFNRYKSNFSFFATVN